MNMFSIRLVIFEFKVNSFTPLTQNEWSFDNQPNDTVYPDEEIHNEIYKAHN